MLDFEIKRRAAGGAADPISITVPFAGSRGVAIMRDDADTGDRPQAKLATGEAIGLLKRDVLEDGPSTLDLAQVWPGRAELPDKVGNECTLEPLPDALEAEGATYLQLSGTGSLTTGTSIGTKLSFQGGKLAVAQTGQTPQYKLSAIMTPATAGRLRVYAERI